MSPQDATASYEVVHAENAEHELAALKDAELVLLDLNLPDLDGYEVCLRIREISDLPIIAVTGRSDELDRGDGPPS